MYIYPSPFFYRTTESSLPFGPSSPLSQPEQQTTKCAQKQSTPSQTRHASANGPQVRRPSPLSTSHSSTPKLEIMLMLL
jgi:hypothetical protein